MKTSPSSPFSSQQLARPSLRAVRDELRAQLDAYLASYAEADGVVRDRAARHSIACLHNALKLLGGRPRAS